MMMKKSIFALALVLALAHCGKENKPTTPTGGGTTPQPEVYTNIADVLRAPDRRALVGKKVELRGTEVQAVVGTYTFWVGDRMTKIPVVRGDRIAGPVSTHVQPGKKANIAGTIRLVDRVEESNPMWDKVNEKERKEILNAGVYILATKVEPIR